jgi:hypothetical protein
VRPRSANIFATVTFASIIFGVPIIQTTLELREGERPQALEVFTQKPTVDNVRAYEAGLEEASWAVKKLRPWMQYIQFVFLKEAGKKAIIGRDDWLFYRPAVEYATRRVVRHGGVSGPGDPLGAIVSFREQLAAHGVQLLILLAPNKVSIYPEMLSSQAQGTGSVVCPETRELCQGLQAAGVEVVDLFTFFQEARPQGDKSGGQRLYLGQDSHWSPAGVELAAEAVARRVLERGWVSLGNVEFAETPVRLRRPGDLVRMLQSPQIERHAGSEDIVCKQVVTREGGMPYQDAPDSEVLVLGDSFLRIYEQDEPGAAGFAAHLAKELKQPLASIINDGGASTLVRQELYRRPQLLTNKKLVIYEFVERDIRFGTEGWQIIPLPPTSAADDIE